MSEITITDAEYAAMVTCMSAYGQSHGVSAAAWWHQDTLGGRASGDVVTLARMILVGIEDCDPAVLDTLPHADLSGEWADGDTPESVYAEAAGTDWPEWDTLPAEVQTDLTDAWRDAFDGAVIDAIEHYCADLATSAS